jgi:galactose mutarotase-like enzyme
MPIRLPTRTPGLITSARQDATAIRANVGWKGTMLVPYANRIKNGTYTLNGETHFLERNEDRGIYGKIALHGYLYRKAMNVCLAHICSGTESSIYLSLVHPFSRLGGDQRAH